jgi:hypothetical protein
VLTLETKPLRVAGAGAVVVAAALPLLPGHDAVTCPLRATTGAPCPFCGMTRGVGRALRGDLAGAALLNPGSVLLVVAAVALVAAVRRPTVRVPAWVPVVLVAALWSFQLVKLATGRPL